MSANVSRRGFMKTAGVASGVMIMAGRAPFSYAQNSKVKVGCIGTGGQGSFHVRDGIMGASAIEITAVCDVYGPHQKVGVKLAQLSNAGIEVGPTKTSLTADEKARAGAAYKPKSYYSHKDMLSKEKLDAVVIATPLHTHHQLTIDALDADCYVFCEKTMCYTIEQAREVVIKCNEKNRFVQVGHQRRYNPVYNKALMMAREEGVLGRINHIDCQWHRNNDWRRPFSKSHKLNTQEKRFIKDLGRHMNWRLYKETSCGLMTELATHQLDISSWFLDCLPKSVVGFGGIDYWRDGREVFDNVNVIYDFNITPESRGYYAMNARNSDQDKQAINDPYNVRVCYSSITANAQKGCSESIQGDKGTFELTEKGSFSYEEATAKINWASNKGGAKEAEQNASVITSGGTLQLSNEAVTEGTPITVDNDKSVDQLQFIRFAKDIQSGGTPKANQMVGLRATIMGISGMQAMRDGVQVDIDPAWEKFDFPTPDAGVVG